jgi:hypothetical protein
VVTGTVVVGSYCPLPEHTEVLSRAAKAKKKLRFRTPAKLYVYDPILERLAQGLEDMAAELGQPIQEEDGMARPRHIARPRHVAPADQPDIRDGVMGARHGRVVTTAVRPPVQAATPWMQMVSRASARVMSGRMVVRHRASGNVRAPAAPSRSRLCPNAHIIPTFAARRQRHQGQAALRNRRCAELPFRAVDGQLNARR